MNEVTDPHQDDHRAAERTGSSVAALHAPGRGAHHGQVSQSAGDGAADGWHRDRTRTLVPISRSVARAPRRVNVHGGFIKEAENRDRMRGLDTSCGKWRHLAGLQPKSRDQTRSICADWGLTTTPGMPIMPVMTSVGRCSPSADGSICQSPSRRASSPAAGAIRQIKAT